jgi:hypothetical protein
MSDWELPKHSLFKAWDQNPTEVLDVDKIISMYENGFAGAVYSPESEEELKSYLSIPNGNDVCRIYGFEESFKDKLVIPYQHIEKYYGNDSLWQGLAQKSGNCVAQAQEMANLLTLCCEVSSRTPDSVSGYVETLPESENKSKKDGPIAWEPIYWFRGHNGDGWYCSASVQTCLKYCGVIPRINIEGVGDFREDNDSLGHTYGRNAPPQSVIDKLDNNLFRDATQVKTFEAIRDLLGRGFGINSCGSEGFSNKRDENGVSRRQGSWAHAMSYIGADDRPETRSKYGGPLVLVLNSWGLRWNSGPREIMGTNGILIPEGSFWAKWSDLQRRDAYAMAGLNGWAIKELPDLNPGFV